MKCVEVGKTADSDTVSTYQVSSVQLLVGSWLSFTLQFAFLSQKMRLKKCIFDCDVMMTSLNPYDTFYEVVVNHAKFDAPT